MTAPRLEKRTRSFDETQNEPPSSDFVAAGADPHPPSQDGEAEPPRSLPIDSDAMPIAMKRALRAARTPLIAGIDFKPATAARDSDLLDSNQSDGVASEKARVDTLSPLDSVPPPAPYPLEPPPARPSVVPPIRLAHGDAQVVRARSDPPPPRLHSEPPPRIPISDRPARIQRRSDPPPRISRSDPPLRISRSDPPPRSSRRDPPNQRRSWDEGALNLVEPVPISDDARRREAETIPADARSPANPSAYDPSLPIPSLRGPNIPYAQFPSNARQHENSRLRNVAMTMMFVIFIVAGAIAGMRWYVAREDEHLAPGPSVLPPAPQVARVKLDRLEPNALVAPRRPSTASPDPVDVTNSPTASTRITGSSAASPAPGSATANAQIESPPTAVESPWKASDRDDRHPAGVSAEPFDMANRSRAATRNAKTLSPQQPGRKRTTATNPPAGMLDRQQIDTKTPLIQD